MDALSHSKRCKDMPIGPIAGASLFVFSLDPQWGNIYFWLGKERKNPRWPQGSETWSDFGGRAMSDDDDAAHVAAREFWEETCGSLRYFEHDELPRKGMEDIAESLRREEYLFRVTMWTETADGTKRLFVTFVKQIPWSPEAHDIFHESHQYLQKLRGQSLCAPEHIRLDEVLSVFPHPAIELQHPGSNSVHINTDFLEKNCIRMWSIPQLRSSIELQILREERQKKRAVAPTMEHASEIMVRSMPMQPDRFRPCFISMAATILAQLPLHESSMYSQPQQRV